MKQSDVVKESLYYFTNKEEINELYLKNGSKKVLTGRWELEGTDERIRYCPKCRKALRYRLSIDLDDEVANIVGYKHYLDDHVPSFLDAPGEEDEGEYVMVAPRGIERLYGCECDGTFYSLLSQAELDRLADAGHPFPKGVRGTATWHECGQSCGVDYRRETGNISLWSAGFRWLDASKNNVIKLPWFTRLTLNLKTGKILAVTKGLDRRPDIIKRCETCAIPFDLDIQPEAARVFIKKVLEISGLPVRVKEAEKNGFKKYQFFCGDTHTEEVGDFDGVDFVCRLVNAPNVYIEYDEYRKMAQFRGSVKATVGSLLTGGSLMGHISIYTPTTRAYRKEQPRILMDSEQYIKYMCSKLSIPASKTLMKKYRENPMLIGFVAHCNELGIRKIDNLNAMIGFLYEFHEWTKDESKFLKFFVKSVGETSAVRRLCAVSEDMHRRMYWLFGDTATMYLSIKNPEMLKGSLQEVHDRLDLIKRRLDEEAKANKPKVIKPTKTELSRCKTYDGYSFRLAEDIFRLDDLSEKMHICVGNGGYDEPAVNKMLTIYYVVDENGKYAACIEMKNKTLRQAKGYCNRFLEGGVANAVRQWVAEHDIHASGCKDFEKMYIGKSLPIAA